jgi:hypothetical protein
MSTDSTGSNHDHSTREQRQIDEFERVRDSLRGLKFGSVNVIVQDGVIVQIDSDGCH